MNIQSLVRGGIRKVDNSKMLYFLTRGFKRWEEEKDKIPYDVKIGHGLLVEACAKSGTLPPTDLPSLVRLLMKPSEQWGITGIETVYPLDAPLLDKFTGVSYEADDFVEIYVSPEENDQSIMKEILLYCREKELDSNYRKIRMFLSDPVNAVISGRSLWKLKDEILDETLQSLVNQCYEKVESLKNYKKCPHCSWTLVEKDGNWRCNKDVTCRSLANFTAVDAFDVDANLYYRLTPGIQKYTLLPGMAESKIAKRLKKKSYQLTMYPEVDKADIEVFLAGTSVQLDVKDYQNPCQLAQYLIKNEPQENCWYVIPSYHERIYKGYAKRVQNQLQNAGYTNIKVVMENNLIKELER